jgi:cobalt/nickel transport system permease protein
MLAVHALIGVGEALITVAALGFIFRTRPDLLDEKSVSAQGSRGWILAGVLIVLIVVFLSPLASTNPDGLERVAGDLGFIHTGRYASYRILLDYTVPILGSTSMSTILAGAIGVTVLLVLAFLAGRSLQKKS